MRRYGVAEGTRDEILAELEQFRDDREAQGNDDKAETYKAAAGEVRDGVCEVRVGHTLYRVVETHAST